MTAYSIISEIGKGETGTVWKARRNEDNTIVVLKSIPIKDENSRKSIIKEATNLRNLSGYPNCNEYVSCYYDYFHSNWENQNVIFIVSEYIEGKNLRQYIQGYKISGKKIPVENVLKIFRKISKAVNFVHSHGYAHRDIKPENIMIDDNLNIKLIDFAFSCNNDCKGGKQGTPMYFPWEYLTERNDYVAREQAHDVWSTGVTFFELVNFGFPHTDFWISDPKRKTGKQINLDTLQYYQWSKLNPKDSNAVLHVEPDDKYSIEIVNYIVNRMLDVNYETRPKMSIVYHYIDEEYNGIEYDGVVYYRKTIHEKQDSNSQYSGFLSIYLAEYFDQDDHRRYEEVDMMEIQKSPPRAFKVNVISNNTKPEPPPLAKSPSRIPSPSKLISYRSPGQSRRSISKPGSQDM